MKKLILMSFIMLFQMAFSQVSVTKKGTLLKEGQEYRASEYEKVFQNEKAKQYFKKHRTNESLGMIFGIIGGGGIGFGLAKTLFRGKETITTPFGSYEVKKKDGLDIIIVGVGLVGIAIPFVLSSKKNLHKAINLENETSTAFQPYFKVEGSGNGMAISYNF